MRIDTFLADYAQIETNGKANVLGLGWTVTTSPLGQHSLVVLFSADWDETNILHKFRVEFLDGDGLLVNVGEADSPQFIEINGEFEVGRPPGAVRGAPIQQVINFNFLPGIVLRPKQRYEYKVSVEGFPVSSSAAFTVR